MPSEEKGASAAKSKSTEEELSAQKWEIMMRAEL